MELSKNIGVYMQKETYLIYEFLNHNYYIYIFIEHSKTVNSFIKAPASLTTVPLKLYFSIKCLFYK